MWRTSVIALRVAVVTLVMTGIAYPLIMTGLAQLLFSGRANGSLITDERGQEIGAELIGQPFISPAYFHPRPSAAGERGFDAASSGGSNLGPTSKKLRDRVILELARLSRENPDASRPIPAELVTMSASGLDPHLSPKATLWQVLRVARARGLAPARVQAVVEANIEGRDFGLLGEPRINVLLLNLALDRRFGRPHS
jgi:potassium-transporting ATPase KdpC subunit